MAPTPTTPDTAAKPLLTIAETAELLGVSTDTIRRMIARGDLPAYRYGPKLLRIERADLDRMRRPVTSTAAYRDALGRSTR